MEVLNNLIVRSIRSDHGTEFKNSDLDQFFEEKEHYKKKGYLGGGQSVSNTQKAMPNAIWHDFGTLLAPS